MEAAITSLCLKMEALGLESYSSNCIYTFSRAVTKQWGEDEIDSPGARVFKNKSVRTAPTFLCWLVFLRLNIKRNRIGGHCLLFPYQDRAHPWGSCHGSQTSCLLQCKKRFIQKAYSTACTFHKHFYDHWYFIFIIHQSVLDFSSFWYTFKYNCSNPLAGMRALMGSPEVHDRALAFFTHSATLLGKTW